MRQIYWISFFILAISFSANGQFGNQIVDFSTSIRVEKNRIVEERWFEIQVNDQESSWITDVEISHGEGDRFKLLEAVILDPNGKEYGNSKRKKSRPAIKIQTGHFMRTMSLYILTSSGTNIPTASGMAIKKQVASIFM